MKLGVRAHDFGKFSVEELADRVAAQGLNCVQFAPVKAIAGFDDDVGRLSPGFAAHVRDTFARRGVQIAVLGCYINLGDANEASRRPQLERFKQYLRYARDFGCSLVGTETGTLNSDWSRQADDAGERGFQSVRTAVRELAREAEKFGVFVTLECVERFIISGPRRLRRLIDEVDSSNLQVILDPVNLLSPENFRDQRALVEESFELLGDRLAILHAKDFVVENNRLRPVSAGKGQMDYEHFLRLAKRRKPWIQILLEDTDPATIHESVQFMQSVYARV